MLSSSYADVQAQNARLSTEHLLFTPPPPSLSPSPAIRPPFVLSPHPLPKSYVLRIRSQIRTPQRLSIQGEGRCMELKMAGQRRYAIIKTHCIGICAKCDAVSTRRGWVLTTLHSNNLVVRMLFAISVTLTAEFRILWDDGLPENTANLQIVSLRLPVRPIPPSTFRPLSPPARPLLAQLPHHTHSLSDAGYAKAVDS